MLIAAQHHLTTEEAILLFSAIAIGMGMLIWHGSKKWRLVWESFPCRVRRKTPWKRTGLLQIRIDNMTYQHLEVQVLEEGLFISKVGHFSQHSKQILIPWPHFQNLTKFEIPIAGLKFGSYTTILELKNNQTVQLDFPITKAEEAAQKGYLTLPS